MRQRGPAAQGVPVPRRGRSASPSWPGGSAWARATVHRLLTTLVAGGADGARPRHRRLPAGPRDVRAGRRRVRCTWTCTAPPGPVLAAAARGRPSEAVQVGVLDGHEVVYVDRLESSQTLRLFTETGRRVPGALHQLRQGAARPPARAGLERVLARPHRSPELTPTHRSPTRPRSRAELDRIRARGWARGRREREIGVASVAAPIRDVHGEVVAADQHRRPGRPVRGARCAVDWPRWSEAGRGRLAPARLEPRRSGARREPDRTRAGPPVRPDMPDGGEHRMPVTDAPAKARALYDARRDAGADPAVHRRRPDAGHGRRLRHPAASWSTCCSPTATASSATRSGLTSQADAADGRRRLARLRPRPRLHHLPRRRHDPGQPVHRPQGRGRDRRS